MNKIKINRSLRTVKSVITANSPVLLVGATITGIVATGVLSAKAGYKARGIVDAAQAEKGPDAEPLSFQEKTQLTWLCYAVPAVTGVSTVASCMGVHFIHTKRHAALAGLYAVTAGKLDDYKDEIESALGVKKQQEFNDRMAQKSADSNLVNNEVVITGAGSELCYDDWSGRYFTSSMNGIDSVVNEVNGILIDEGELDLNTFYDRLGLTSIPMGSDFGWQHSNTPKLNLIHGSITSPDGRPAIAISFRDAPKPKLGG